MLGGQRKEERRLIDAYFELVDECSKERTKIIGKF
jgi:hypothetical protein